jgi:hypothetical protein
MECKVLLSARQYILIFSNRFRWVFCQLETLRHCLPPSVRHTLAELPRSLDETYERILQEIPRANRCMLIDSCNASQWRSAHLPWRSWRKCLRSISLRQEGFQS